MHANPTEITNFFWHCEVAARMTDEFEDGTVTKSYQLRAVRMATDCCAGRRGVQYASDKARAKRESRGKPWEKSGLIKEHVIPVGVVRGLVDTELRGTIVRAGTVAPLILSELETQGLTPKVVDLFQNHPRAWTVARIIRNWTVHAWITEEEDKRFDDTALHDGISIRKRMPKGWNTGLDRFARYQACGIEISSI